MVGFISACECKSALGNWAVETLIKGAKLDPKTRLSLSEIVPFLGIKQILLLYNVGLSEDLFYCQTQTLPNPSSRDNC